MLKYAGEIFIERAHLHMYHRSSGTAKQQQWKLQYIIFAQSSASHFLLLIYSSVLSPASTISSCLFPFFFFSCSATQIDSAFLISQHNPINFIVIAAINI